MMSPDDKARIFINIEVQVTVRHPSCIVTYQVDLCILFFLQDLLKTHTKFVVKLEKGCSNGGMQISPVFLEFVRTHTCSLQCFQW